MIGLLEPGFKRTPHTVQAKAQRIVTMVTYVFTINSTCSIKLIHTVTTLCSTEIMVYPVLTTDEKSRRTGIPTGGI
jgi:hypothetical protein